MRNGSKSTGGAKTITVAVLMSGTLSGCATVGAHVRYGALESKTELSESVFMDLTNELPPTVYVSERHTAGRAVSTEQAMESALASAGYTLVDDPRDATYVVQVNHRQLVRQELGDGQGIQDAIGGAWMAGAGTAVAAEVLGIGEAAGELGLAVGVLSFLLDAQTKHLAHTLTTDVHVTEKRSGPEGTDTREHSTQIVTAASKVNLGEDEAMPALVAGVTQAITGLLPAVQSPQGRSRRTVPYATEGDELPRR